MFLDLSRHSPVIFLLIFLQYFQDKNKRKLSRYTVPLISHSNPSFFRDKR